MKKLIIIGAGGHSKSVVDSIDKTQIELCGFIDQFKTGDHYGRKILGNSIESVENYQDYYYIVAIGDNKIRKNWYDKITKLNLKLINIVDKTAIISSTAKIGFGNFIGKYAIINADSVIGDNNIINTKALVEHECVVGNHVHLSTNSTINGNVKVEDNVFFGSIAVCNGQITLGYNSIIGSGSVIIKDVLKNTTVVGVPGRVVKVNNE